MMPRRRLSLEPHSMTTVGRNYRENDTKQCKLPAELVSTTFSVLSTVLSETCGTGFDFVDSLLLSTCFVFDADLWRVLFRWPSDFRSFKMSITAVSAAVSVSDKSLSTVVLLSTCSVSLPVSVSCMSVFRSSVQFCISEDSAFDMSQRRDTSMTLLSSHDVSCALTVLSSISCTLSFFITTGTSCCVAMYSRIRWKNRLSANMAAISCSQWEMHCNWKVSSKLHFHCFNGTLQQNIQEVVQCTSSTQYASCINLHWILVLEADRKAHLTY